LVASDREGSPCKDKRGFDLISDVLPFGRLWYDTPDNAIGYAMHSSRSHNAMIRVYDAASNVIETHEHKGDLRSGEVFYRKSLDIFDALRVKGVFSPRAQRNEKASASSSRGIFPANATE